MLVLTILPLNHPEDVQIPHRYRGLGTIAQCPYLTSLSHMHVREAECRGLG